MGIIATNESKPRELIPAGNYVARCYSMVHIGTVKEDFMNEIKFLNKVRITWELPTELRVFKEENGEQPMVISQEFTLSMNEKANLRKFLESWRGDGFTEEQAKNFDITKLLGISCMLSIIHKTTKKGSKYETISSVATLPKGITCPPAINPIVEFNFTDKFSEKVLESFPEFIKVKIKSSAEYNKLNSPENTDIQEAEVIDEEIGLNVVEKDDMPF